MITANQNIEIYLLAFFFENAKLNFWQKVTWFELLVLNALRRNSFSGNIRIRFKGPNINKNILASANFLATVLWVQIKV